MKTLTQRRKQNSNFMNEITKYSQGKKKKKNEIHVKFSISIKLGGNDLNLFDLRVFN